MSQCPVCSYEATIHNEGSEREQVNCDRCGKYFAAGSVIRVLPGIIQNDPEGIQKLRYGLRKITNGSSDFVLTTVNLQDLLTQTELPTPPEQLDNLILFLGNIQLDPGYGLEDMNESYLSEIGCKSLNGLGYICESAKERGFVECNVTYYIGNEISINSVALTMNGWLYFQELNRGYTHTLQAFMAMKFNEPELVDLYKKFKAGVGDTGFTLKRLDEEQPAGLIDDRLRVEIRQSKFLIADLSHHNNGAYWEAGFAEGLGRPVIYTCRKDVFNDKANTTHFDTNHHLTVVWDPENIDEAVIRLKATIRATLPGIAKMSDV